MSYHKKKHHSEKFRFNCKGKYFLSIWLNNLACNTIYSGKKTLETHLIRVHEINYENYLDAVEKEDLIILNNLKGREEIEKEK